MCQQALTDLDALKYMLPWLVAEAEATIALMGADYWAYGIPKNRRMIETQTRWSYEQGLSSRLFTAADLFDSSTLDWNG